MDGTALEINFDSIAGPSYNYEALAPGNLASVANLGKVSNPQSVALEGLDKIALLLDIGVPQALLPPLVRPNLDALFRIGLLKDPALLTASDTRSLAAHLSKAAHKAPHLLAACFSGSSFWTNNSATVSPSADADDNKVHLTPANMISSFHRSLEASDAPWRKPTRRCTLGARAERRGDRRHPFGGALQRQHQPEGVAGLGPRQADPYDARPPRSHGLAMFGVSHERR
jgi:succinylarginine dihydrolase